MPERKGVAHAYSRENWLEMWKGLVMAFTSVVEKGTTEDIHSIASNFCYHLNITEELRADKNAASVIVHNDGRYFFTADTIEEIAARAAEVDKEAGS